MIIDDVPAGGDKKANHDQDKEIYVPQGRFHILHQHNRPDDPIPQKVLGQDDNSQVGDAEQAKPVFQAASLTI
ncbi:MAG: hypothetical protein C5S40_00315 [ANME-2 cluster archaeon]|nr:hypothetical protein [ANME-2 cluster archaeon]